MIKIGGARRSSNSRILYVGGNDGYVIKLKNADLNREVAGYDSILGYLPVPRRVCVARMGSYGAIIYRRTQRLSPAIELFADALFGEDKEAILQVSSQLLQTYERLVSETGQWLPRRSVIGKLFFDRALLRGRLGLWFRDPFRFSEFHIETAEGGRPIALEEMRRFLDDWANREEDVFAIISQGDPTEMNIAMPLCFLDFETAGLNPLLGDIANYLWSIHVQGGYFVPIYNPVAVEFRTNVENSVKRNQPICVYSVDYDRKTVLARPNFGSDSGRLLALRCFESSTLWRLVKARFQNRGLDAEREMLPYLLCRILLVFDPRRMSERDTIFLLAIATNIYQYGVSWYLKCLKQQEI